MRVLIVHAHPEANSFNGGLTAAARGALAGAGHEVRVSDLYREGFDPVSDRRNFTSVKDAAYFKQQVEEKHASEVGGFAEDVRREMESLFWCDTLIFQFPLWWFGAPAILKGWVDRVFAYGSVYGHGRWYDRGTQAGKRAMCSVTIGGASTAYEPDGLHGDLDRILYPIHHGVFAFTGFTALTPHVIHGPARMTEEERRRAIEGYAEAVLELPTREAIRYPSLERYDERFKLRS